MRRPKLYDDAVITRAAELLAKGLPDDLGERDSVTADLYRAIRGAMSPDGYAIAKELEELGWDINADLVEQLDDGGLYDAVDELTEAWVKAEQRRPLLLMGAVVTVTLKREGQGIGTVTAIDDRVGTYTVCVPSFGHVTPGQLGTQGVILEWERLEEMQAPAVPEKETR